MIYLDEKLIGEADVKSPQTYFSVQRSNPFTKNDNPIPFDTALVTTILSRIGRIPSHTIGHLIFGCWLVYEYLVSQ